VAEPASGSAYVAIDADGHVHEAEECFQHYLAAEFRARVPGPVLNRHNVRRFVFDGREEPPFPLEISIRKPMAAADRIKVLDKERIWAAMLFPSGILSGLYSNPPDLCRALATAYIDWMRDYCAPFSDRLLFAAALPLHDVLWAVTEARRAVTLGARALALRPNRAAGESWDDPAYDPFYAAVQEMGVPLVFHETTGDPNTAGGDRYGMRNPARYAFSHIISHSFEQMWTAMSVICGGVLEKFPRLKVLFAECGCSWAPYWLARLDDHFEHRVMGRQMPIKLKPSEYFYRQCFVTCEPRDATVPLAIQGIGAERILFSTDYPHFDSAGGAVRSFLAADTISTADQRKILLDNAAHFYGIQVPASVF
jgi:uncharacterized protein